MLAMIAGNIKKDEKYLLACGEIFIGEGSFVEFVKCKRRNGLRRCLC
jgi:hypothetical protein